MRQNDLEYNLNTLVEAKVINLDVTLASLLRGGALSGLDPWDVWCGNGWILRRRGPFPPRFEVDALRGLVREELVAAGVIKGG